MVNNQREKIQTFNTKKYMIAPCKISANEISFQ